MEDTQKKPEVAENIEEQLKAKREREGKIFDNGFDWGTFTAGTVVLAVAALVKFFPKFFRP